jgi:transposase
MKSAEEANRMLEHYDLTRSLRAAAELSGVSHHTVARVVARRDAGQPPDDAVARDRVIEPHFDKLEEWVDRSKGRIRADIAQRKLIALGYGGSERTTRREVARLKAAWHAGHRRVHRPWVVEPGMWFQWDYGTGPTVGGTATQLFCAWLAWSRYRVVFPIRDKTLPTVIGAIDRTLRAFGGVPTYALTDNEKTVTVEHVARIAVRHPDVVAASVHYGLTVATCLPADAPTKGGSEATVRVAKADLVPTDANLLAAYASWAEVEAAAGFCATVNARPHRVTRRAPAEMLAEEQAHLHRLPTHPYTVAFGHTRTVGADQPTIQHDWCVYSVPWQLRGDVVWVREAGDDIVVVHVGPTGAVEVARHQRTTPGNPRIDPAHFPPAPEGALARTPVAQNAQEAAFLALGPGAAHWLREAADAGVRRMRAKMDDAVALGKIHGAEAVDWALGHAAVMGRFAEGDLASIVAHHARCAPGPTQRASEDHSLAQGTGAWEGFGR